KIRPRKLGAKSRNLPSFESYATIPCPPADFSFVRSASNTTEHLRWGKRLASECLQLRHTATRASSEHTMSSAKDLSPLLSYFFQPQSVDSRTRLRPASTLFLHRAPPGRRSDFVCPTAYALPPART